MSDYAATRDRVETYFDRTATQTWERLTSDAPVSGIRATVRAGRDRMRALLLAQLPDDLRGCRVLDAGCGTGALATILAERGAQVVAIDIAPALIDIAARRTPAALADRITWKAGDMTDPALGQFDYIVAMDSMIYYRAADLAAILTGMAPRLTGRFVFTVAPRTPALMAMWRIGKLFPRADRSPVMVPQTTVAIADALRQSGSKGALREVGQVKSGFYFSAALSFEGRPS